MSQFVELFALASEQMMNSLETTREALRHNLSKGEANEATVRKFLEQRLPKSIGVGSGEILDAGGSRSKQLDVVLYDALSTPILWTDEDQRMSLFPSECVLAVAEVKTTIDVSDVSSVIENMQSVKALDKTSFFTRDTSPDIVTYNYVYGQELQVAPTFYYVVAFEGYNLREFARQCEDSMSQFPVEQRIDCILCINEGVICWYNRTTDMYDCAPSSANDEFRFMLTQNNNALLLFYLLIYRYLSQVRNGPVNLKAYLPRMTF